MPTFDEKHLDKYSDEQLLHFINDIGTPLGSPPCRASLLSSNLVVKRVPSKTLADAVAAQNLARDLVIPVPEIRRIITNKNTSYIIMDRVHGTTLEQCWSELGWIPTITLAFELRKFVRRMRDVTSSIAGGLATGECNSFWLEDYYGLPLHATPLEIQSFITFWLQYPQKKPRLFSNPGNTSQKYDSYSFSSDTLCIYTSRSRSA
jgi:hypothetical protein